jgi:hypothetical protein
LQKRLLVAQSELHRARLIDACEQLDQATRWVPPVCSIARVAWPFTVAAAPFAFWFLRKRPLRWRDFLFQALAGYRAARHLWWLLDLLRGPVPRGRTKDLEDA